MTRRTVQAVSGLLALLLVALLAWSSVAAPTDGLGSAPRELDQPDVVVGWELEPRAGGDEMVLPGGRELPPVPPAPEFREAPWLPWAIMGVVALVVALIVRRLWRRRQDEEFDEGDPLADLHVPVLDRGTMNKQREALHSGTARNGIVACWVELETMLAQAGRGRAAHETSAQVAERIGALHPRAADALTELAELYRGARFSSHEVSEPDRARADAALRVVHDALGEQVRA